MEHTQSISPNVDELLLEASLRYKSGNTSNSEEQRGMKTTPKCCLAKPVTLEYLKEKVKNSVPVKTRQQTDLSVTLWMERHLSRIKNTGNSIDAPAQLCNISTKEMSSWLSMFVVEIRHPDGKLCPCSNLKHILAGIQ